MGSLLSAWIETGGLPPLVRNTKDGSVFVLVPGGEFEMGDGKEATCPKHRVFLDAFYMGVTCVTNRQYGAYRKEAGSSEWKWKVGGRITRR